MKANKKITITLGIPAIDGDDFSGGFHGASDINLQVTPPAASACCGDREIQLSPNQLRFIKDNFCPLCFADPALPALLIRLTPFDDER